MIIGSPVTISSDGMELMGFDSMSKASTSTGIPYVTLLYAKKNSRQGAPGDAMHPHQVGSNGKENIIIYHWLKCLTVISNGEPPRLTQE